MSTIVIITCIALTLSAHAQRGLRYSFISAQSSTALAGAISVWSEHNRLRIFETSDKTILYIHVSQHQDLTIPHTLTPLSFQTGNTGSNAGVLECNSLWMV